MRLPYPEKFNTQFMLFGALGLMLAQILEGTEPLFAIFIFIAIIAWTYTFNLLGGLNRVSGMFVFGQGALGIVLPELVKAFLGEPADSRLLSPLLTAEVFCAGHIAIFFVSYLIVRIRPAKALLDSPENKFKTQEMAVGATVLGLGIQGLLSLYGSYSATSGGWATALTQLAIYILPLALALGIIAQIQKTNGRSTIGPVAIIVSSFMIITGAIHSNKEAVMMPVAVYVVCCAATRVNFSRLKMLLLAGVAALFLFWIYPMVQSYHSTPMAERGLTFDELSDRIINSPTYIAEYNVSRDADIQSDRLGEYYGKEVGLLDRYSLIGLDAALIDTVKDGDYMGYVGIYEAVLNWFPHVLLPDKPDTFSSQTYFHRLAGTNQNDTTTGISFGVFGTAFAMGGWPGLFLLLPLVQGAFMLELDVLLPSVRNTAWIAGMLAFMLHLGPELNIDYLTSMVGQTPLRMSFAILVIRYGVRLFSSFFGGSQRGEKLAELVAVRHRQKAKLPVPQP